MVSTSIENAPRARRSRDARTTREKRFREIRASRARSVRRVRERRARCERPPANQSPTGRIESTVSRTTRRARRERLARENDSDVFSLSYSSTAVAAIRTRGSPDASTDAWNSGASVIRRGAGDLRGGLISPITTRRTTQRILFFGGKSHKQIFCLKVQSDGLIDS